MSNENTATTQEIHTYACLGNNGCQQSFTKWKRAVRHMAACCPEQLELIPREQQQQHSLEKTRMWIESDQSGRAKVFACLGDGCQELFVLWESALNHMNQCQSYRSSNDQKKPNGRKNQTKSRHKAKAVKSQQQKVASRQRIIDDNDETKHSASFACLGLTCVFVSTKWFDTVQHMKSCHLFVADDTADSHNPGTKENRILSLQKAAQGYAPLQLPQSPTMPPQPNIEEDTAQYYSWDSGFWFQPTAEGATPLQKDIEEEKVAPILPNNTTTRKRRTPQGNVSAIILDLRPIGKKDLLGLWIPCLQLAMFHPYPCVSRASDLARLDETKRGHKRVPLLLLRSWNSSKKHGCCSTAAASRQSAQPTRTTRQPQARACSGCDFRAFSAVALKQHLHACTSETAVRQRAQKLVERQKELKERWTSKKAIAAATFVPKQAQRRPLSPLARRLILAKEKPDEKQKKKTKKNKKNQKAKGALSNDNKKNKSKTATQMRPNEKKSISFACLGRKCKLVYRNWDAAVSHMSSCPRFQKTRAKWIEDLGLQHQGASIEKARSLGGWAKKG